MAFPRRLLTEGEDLVLDLRPHWIALVWPVAQTLLIAAAITAALVYLPDSWPSWMRWTAVVLGVVAFFAWPARKIVAWATSHFVVTTHRVIRREGWFAKRSKEIPLEKVSDVTFDQSVFDRIIGAGTLVIESPGEFGQERFVDVRDPENVQKAIYEVAERALRRISAPDDYAAAAFAPPIEAPVSVADELTKLDRLRDEGVLTDEEFAEQKARLLRSD